MSSRPDGCRLGPMCPCPCAFTVAMAAIRASRAHGAPLLRSSARLGASGGAAGERWLLLGGIGLGCRAGAWDY